MKDSEFKALPHRTGSHKVRSRGSEVAKGYKPDLTISDSSGQLVYIVESEQKTDRKAFLGDLMKAEKFAEDSQARPTLIIVMQPFSNATVQQIVDHMGPYAAWLARLKGGSLHLSSILIISDTEYEQSVRTDELIGSAAFLSRSKTVKVS